MVMRAVARPDVLARFKRLLEECSMGEVRVPVRISNYSDPDQFWEGDFLVDTGATSSHVPASMLLSIGIEPQFARRIWLADESSIRRPVGAAKYELLGDEYVGEVILSQEGTPPILGLTVLESLGLVVDPQGERILPRSAIRV